jgi:GntR family transcriptional regulator
MPDLIELDESNGIPIWVQLRNRLIYLITIGHYKAGEQLPTVRSLAAEVHVNYNTVNKVYTSLEREGYITTRRGLGTFVCDIEKLGGPESTMDVVIDDFIRKCLDFGMPLEHIVDQVRERVDRMQGVPDLRESHR